MVLYYSTLLNKTKEIGLIRLDLLGFLCDTLSLLDYWINSHFGLEFFYVLLYVILYVIHYLTLCHTMIICHPQYNELLFINFLHMDFVYECSCAFFTRFQTAVQVKISLHDRDSRYDGDEF